MLSFLQVKSLPGVNNDDVGSLRSSDWTHREMCPVIKWLDDIKVPYVYSAWENYYRSNDTMWYISQHGHVRSYRISKRYTYECVPSSCSKLVCRVTKERRNRCKETAGTRHPVYSSSELSFAYTQLRQHRVYRLVDNDSVELHLCLHKRFYNIWTEINVTKFYKLSPSLQKRVFAILNRCSNHLKYCVASTNRSCTDMALQSLQRRNTGMY